MQSTPKARPYAVAFSRPEELVLQMRRVDRRPVEEENKCGVELEGSADAGVRSNLFLCFLDCFPV